MEKKELSPAIKRARALVALRLKVTNSDETLEYIGDMEDYSVYPPGKIALFNCIVEGHTAFGGTFAEEIKDEQQEKLA